MKIFVALLAVLSTVYAHSQSLYIDTTKQNSINTRGEEANRELSAFLGMFEDHEKNTQWHNKPDETEYEDDGTERQPVLQKFTIDTISKQQFAKFKAGYKNRINFDSSLIKWTDTSYFIQYENSKTDTFVANKNDYSFFEYYSGLLEPLNLYIVHSIAASQEVGTMVLYDKKTGKAYFFESFTDYPIDSVSVSPENSYFLGYVNDLYDNTCRMMLYRINKEDKSYTLENFHTLSMNKTAVKELVWVNENTFAIVATAGYSDEYNPLPSVYLKVSFK